ncbi:uncharacterized protein LOC126378802 isoform X2 [Pectinophora gossypiella]|uniref:uncharacterized protein LOC126378802 isoform X2 n=1 Tax=Pectinophora gossypiella TaxID=13191 RepID=UPI00214E6F7C|nr:uncharacterized protein LOC126378802 isoform X2 [Pectinophora gossypiella]
MDDTQLSKASDAGAKRKRRSSILKSQRPPRAPFSELEFNVATPTDTGKSRRVSFSRRTGVAEFVTNEATTTWKNFYEEHNKTLESSGNDSEVNPPRQSVGCLGKRIFDQQFQEVEAVDYTCNLNDGRGVETSINNVNFELALECSADERKPHQNFELSEFTEQQSRLFGDDLAVSGVGEISDKINVNFSVMQQVGDDLDEIQKDLEQHAKEKNVVCAGPTDRNNLSEYIEVDLNTTHAAMKAEESDMSITDTIHSPKVNVSRTNVSTHNEKSMNLDWVADKENILVNPYVAPKETDNFAINEEPDKVLVFDGKRLTIQSDKEPLSDYRKTLLPNTDKEKTPQRKTIVLNVDDDLPNFVDNPHVSMSHHSRNMSVANNTVFGNDGDLSMTQPLAAKLETNTEKRKTILFEDAMNDISVTQALPTNIMQEKVEKRRTIVFDSDGADISVTQAVPSNLLITEKDSHDKAALEKRKTIVYEDDDGNISITQALPTNVILSERNEVIPVKRKTIVFETDAGNISVTQVVPSTIILTDRPESIVFTEKTGNISITQAVSSNLILVEKPKSPEKLSSKDSKHTPLQKCESLIERVVRQEYEIIEKSVMYDQEVDISVTQAVHSNLILSEKRKSIVYDDGDISMTQAVPSNLLLTEERSEKCKTVIYEDDTADISMTQAIPNVILSENTQDSSNIIERFIDKVEPSSEKRKTIVYEEDEGDVSMTLAVPAGAILIDTDNMSDKSNSTKDAGETTPTSSGSTVLQEAERVDSNEADISVTGSDDVMEDVQIKPTPLCKDNVKVCVSESDSRSSYENLVQRHRRDSIKPIPQDIMALEKKLLSVSNYKNATLEASHLQDVLVYQTSTNPAPIKPSRNDQKEFLTEISSSSAIAGQTDTDNNMKQSLVDIPPTSATETESTVTSSPQKLQSPKSLTPRSEPSDPNRVTSGPHSQSDIGYGLIESASAVSEIRSTIQKSILNDLLDMRDGLDGDGIDDKSVTAKIPSETKPEMVNPDTSEDSLFFIMKDSTDETEKSDEEKSVITKNLANHKLAVMKKKAHLVDTSPLQIEFKNCMEDIGKKLIELQQRGESGSPPHNRHFERVFSSDVDSNNSRRKSYKDVDSTKDILDMLSQFTDKEEEQDPIEPIKVKGRPALEDKTESRRMSTIPRRQSVVLSREDMLSNISMAQAVLQKSHNAHSDSETDNVSSTEKSQSPTKTPRSSPEVVKTLRFEDDESSDTSTKFEMGLTTPLKKTAFGETSYMIAERKRNDSKPNVIPTYLKDVSDGIKALMSDLVKPMADVMPFDTGLDKDSTLKRNVSTCSTQIQANLITSSQIDLDPEPHSNPESLMTLSGNKKLKGIIKPYYGNPSASEPGTTSERSFEVDWRTSSDHHPNHYDNLAGREELDLYAPLRPYHADRAVDATVPGRVIVFDPRNPLNNVLLAPIDMQQAHRYDPTGHSSDDIDNHRPPNDIDRSKLGNFAQVSFKDEGSEADEKAPNNYTTYNVPSIIPNFVTQNDACVKKTSDESYADDKPVSVDHSVETLNEMKDEEVNTVIVMKDNKRLLEESSSLTLVDDTEQCERVAPYFGELDSGTSKNASPSPTVRSSRSSTASPVEVIYTQSNKLDSDLNSEDEVRKVLENRKKRKHEKHKYCQLADLDVTPKPCSKMSKISTSPLNARQRSPENLRYPDSRTESDTKSYKRDTKRRSQTLVPVKPKRAIDKSPHKSPKHKKPGTTITVQRLITEYHITDMDKDVINTQILDAISNREGENVMQTMRSIVSSPAGKDRVDEEAGEEMGDARSCAGELSKERALPMDWQSGLVHDLSRSSVPDRELGIDVVEKIDMLPFMGRECEWESSSEEGWSFRLLHGRLRLVVRLAAAPPAAAWRATRPDTPVAALLLEVTRQDKKNEVAALCVRFAAEAMRYLVGRGVSRAAEVPALLRRCAGVARVALRWGRAMHDAWTHLAYTLSGDGLLTLKVANIPLRSVWEVTMKIELVVSDAREVPWPRASELRVSSVVSDICVPPDELQRVTSRLRHDWGHAPRTLWKVFKYLKNKIRDDDLVLGL